MKAPLTALDCHYIAEPNKLVNAKTGALVPVPSGTNPLAWGIRKLEMVQDTEKAIGWRGPMNSIGLNSDDYTQGKCAGWQTGPLTNVTIGGLDSSARLNNSGISHDMGAVDELTIQDATIVCTSGSKMCFGADQHNTKFHKVINLSRLFLIEAPGANCYWGINGDSAAIWRLDEIKGVHPDTGAPTIFKEHLAYMHNAYGHSWIRNSYAALSGRTGTQWVTRDWRVSGSGYGCDKHAAPGDLLEITDNVFEDCSTWWDPNMNGGAGGWFGNGSAITCAGFPADVLVARNLVKQTHNGGGLCVFYPDAKVGAHKTAAGHAIGNVTFERNTFAGEADPTANTGARSQVAIGGCDSVLWKHTNTIKPGLNKELTVNHSGPNGSFFFTVKSGETASQMIARTMGPDQAVYKYIDSNTSAPLTKAQIDAMGIPNP